MPTQKKTRCTTGGRGSARRSSKNSSKSGREKAGMRSGERRNAPRCGGLREGGQRGDSHKGVGRSKRSVRKHLEYSKWINSPDDHEDHQGQSLVTRNHDVILQWSKLRKALPSVVGKVEGRDGGDVLGIDLPGYGHKRLKKVGWDKWFNMFDQRNLVFLYQERKKDGSKSTFCKVVA